MAFVRITYKHNTNNRKKQITYVFLRRDDSLIEINKPNVVIYGLDGFGQGLKPVKTEHLQNETTINAFK